MYNFLNVAREPVELLWATTPAVEEPVRDVLFVGLVDCLDDASSVTLLTVSKIYELELSVVICATGTVMFVKETPLTVYAHKQYGICVGMKSPVVL